MCTSVIDTILHIENPREWIDKLLEIVSGWKRYLDARSIYKNTIVFEITRKKSWKWNFLNVHEFSFGATTNYYKFNIFKQYLFIILQFLWLRSQAQCDSIPCLGLLGQNQGVTRSLFPSGGSQEESLLSLCKLLEIPVSSAGVL